MFILFSVFYILIAAAMIVLILMQRGAGADAGSGFGGGASATVFGARGSSSFMTRATAVLAALFFVLSLGMGIYLSRTGNPQPAADLGVMSGAAVPAAPANNAVAPAADVPKAPSAGGDVPAATAPAANNDVPAPQQAANPASASTAKK
ncbi:preprotein translocase subunit SecG [Luteibacter pinisoli]|jgi:preprotein translocase subunit SecG|uniref:Protein-export membrane protein SecG n=1 Tax=Luteibacter pinisoli TaxID=2589080 RepID=A0A4Y5Z3S0_9GAMM|nr:preprotein translocase subunit SecG [Luteibacter pinisoli]QDE39179.1 preprotein translocase subunit SecG [Luteibacter pinisoli]